MRRRELITLLGGTAATRPLAARAQQLTMPVVGYLSSEAEAAEAGTIAALGEGLREQRFITDKTDMLCPTNAGRFGL